MFLLDPVLSGILAGLLIALLALGPSFFTLVKLGIHHHFYQGALFALGIFISDLLIVVLAYFGLSQLSETLLFKQVFSLAGGILVLVYGIRSFRNPPAVSAHQIETSKNNLRIVIEGFGLNILNPATFVMWLFVIATVNELRDYGFTEITVFFTSVLLCVFAMDLLKTYLAHRTGRGLSYRMLRRINHGIGCILIILGFRLFYDFIELVSTHS